jgi:hypothetical protein
MASDHRLKLQIPSTKLQAATGDSVFDGECFGFQAVGYFRFPDGKPAG